MTRRSGILLCYPFDKKRLAKWEPPYIVQPKLNGIRCRAVWSSAIGYVLVSSEENSIISVPHINKELNETGLQCELDGELYVHGYTWNDIDSITSRTTNRHNDYESMEFHIFDVVDETEPQVRRTSILNGLELKGSHLRKVPFDLCNDFDDVMKTYEGILSDAYEGIVIRNLAGLYVRKRSTLVMKFKPKKDDFYEIVDYSEELNKYGFPKHSLGSLTCRGVDGNLFNVGSGFTATQRKELWEDPESLIGKYCHVQYQNLTPGRQVPLFPVFMNITDVNPERL